MNQELQPFFEVLNGSNSVDDAYLQAPGSGSVPKLPDYEDIVARYPDLANAKCVFVSGSLVSGWGNERSDLDIFVIANEGHVRDVIPDSVVKVGRTDQDIEQAGFVVAMGSVGGVRADIEFWTAEYIDGLISQTRPRSERYLGRKGHPTYEEQDLLYRLSIGRALSGHDWLTERKRQIQESDYPIWIAENHKVHGENQLEDLVGMYASNDIKSATLMARDSYTSALQAILAFQGDVSPSGKWIAHRLAQAKLGHPSIEEAWAVLTMRDCTEPDWPMATARRAHRIFLTVEQEISGHSRCGTTESHHGIERRLGVRTYRIEGDTIIADVTKCRTNAVGGYIWSLCDGIHAEADIARCLARDFGLNSADAAEYVTSALSDLRAKGLI